MPLTNNDSMAALQRLELTSDAGVMREFRSTPYYVVFRKYADQLVLQFQGRAMAGSKEEFDFWKGAYHGAQDTSRLPDTIMAMVEDLAEEKKL